jgi:hypothetical protein
MARGPGVHDRAAIDGRHLEPVLRHISCRADADSCNGSRRTAAPRRTAAMGSSSASIVTPRRASSPRSLLGREPPRSARSGRRNASPGFTQNDEFALADQRLDVLPHADLAHPDAGPSFAQVGATPVSSKCCGRSRAPSGGGCPSCRRFLRPADLDLAAEGLVNRLATSSTKLPSLLRLAADDPAARRRPTR